MSDHGSKKGIDDVDLKGKLVLIRVDFNVPQVRTTMQLGFFYPGVL